MRFFSKKHKNQLQGAVLLEAVIAIGLFVAIVPLFSRVFVNAGESKASSSAETYSNWIVPFCIQETLASREGKSLYLPTSFEEQTFPLGEDSWALVFSSSGKPVGKINKNLYENGTRKLEEHSISYIALISSVQETEIDKSCHTVCISLEYPASAKAVHRKKLNFYTHVP